MKIFNLKSTTVLLGIICTTVSFAQGTQTGGGRERERSLEHMMLDLIPYLESSEGIESFPEVQDYNKSHPHETFSDLLRNTSVVLSPGSVKDGFDADRDCVSHFGDPKNRYIECNQVTMLDETELKNQAAIYGFLFHEILVQAGLEKSRSATIPSDYHISKRMEFHKETFDKMMPGKENLSSSDGVCMFGRIFAEKQAYTVHSQEECIRLAADVILPIDSTSFKVVVKYSECPTDGPGECKISYKKRMKFSELQSAAKRSRK